MKPKSKFLLNPDHRDFIPRKSRLQFVSLGVGSWRDQCSREQFLSRLAELTPREREIMDGVAQGKLNRIVGEELGISEKTVKNHRAAVMEKLGVGSLAELVRNLILVEEQ